MKTLANPKDMVEITTRLADVLPTSQRRWGRMSAHQMICHLSDVFRSSMGQRQVSAAAPWIIRPVARWVALRAPWPWPHGFPARPEWDQRIGGTRPRDFVADRRELRRLLDRFAGKPRDFEWQVHPVFGRLSDAEWMRLGYLHMDHHLRQFGA